MLATQQRQFLLYLHVVVKLNDELVLYSILGLDQSKFQCALRIRWDYTPKIHTYKYTHIWIEMNHFVEVWEEENTCIQEETLGLFINFFFFANTKFVLGWILESYKNCICIHIVVIKFIIFFFFVRFMFVLLCMFYVFSAEYILGCWVILYYI